MLIMLIVFLLLVLVVYVTGRKARAARASTEYPRLRMAIIAFLTVAVPLIIFSATRPVGLVFAGVAGVLAAVRQALVTA